MLNKQSIMLGASLLGATMNVFSQKSQSVFKPIDREKNVKPRNIIFILTDDHRYDFFGFTGKVPWLETPNMDKAVRPPM